MNCGEKEIAAQQTLFGKTLGILALIALLSIFISFVLYSLGVPEPIVEPEKTEKLWHLSAGEYNERTDSPKAWQALGKLPASDAVMELALMLVSLSIVVALAALLLLTIRQRDLTYTGITAALIFLIILAAAGAV